MKKPLPIKVTLKPAGEMPPDQFDVIFRMMLERAKKDGGKP